MASRIFGSPLKETGKQRTLVFSTDEGRRASNGRVEKSHDDDGKGSIDSSCCRRYYGVGDYGVGTPATTLGNSVEAIWSPYLIGSVVDTVVWQPQGKQWWEQKSTEVPRK